MTSPSTNKPRASNRLHPQGALRARFMPPPDDVFRRLGVGARKLDLGDEGLYLAEELVAADRWLGGSDPDALAILVLALLIVQREGSTRIPLDPRGRLRELVIDIARVAGLELDVGKMLRAITALVSTPRFNSVIGVGDARLPLIVDGGALYTERARWLEVRVAERLAQRLAAPREDATLDPAIAANLSDAQAHAVRVALGGKLAVVTGGPGTGKTVVAAAIIRGFLQRGIKHVALAAQTGKAANRLSEVIAAQLHAADPSGAIEPPVAQTLHRLLGWRSTGWAHHRHAPLPVDAVIVDEASMIDLELMDALLDALPANVPLVLVGDRHQLPAIDAGQILADLVDLPEAQPAVAVLAHSYRMNPNNPNGRAILAAAAAVNEGAVAKLFGHHPLATPRQTARLQFAGVEWVDTTTSRDAVPNLTDHVWHHFGGPRALALADHVFRFVDGACTEEDRLVELWDLLTRARLLTVTRGLATGSVALNAHLHARAIDRMSTTGRPDFVPGEPVMITQNDYQRGLFNGDQGIIVRADEGLDTHHFRAVFRAGHRFVVHSIEALRDRLELAWAITVHKSQGSEMDAVALVLPHDDLPLVTRELIYTGMTRARQSVVIAAAKANLLAGGKRAVHRYSGLQDRLGRALR